MMEGWKGGRGVTQKSPNQSNKKMHLQCNFTKEEKREKQITVNDLYSIVVYLKLKCVIMLKHVTCMYLCIFAIQELRIHSASLQRSKVDCKPLASKDGIYMCLG